MKELLNEWRNYLKEGESVTPFRFFEKQLSSFAKKLVSDMGANMVKLKTHSYDNTAGIKFTLDFDKEANVFADGPIDTTTRPSIVDISISGKIDPESLEIIPNEYSARLSVNIRHDTKYVETAARDYVGEISNLSDVYDRFSEIIKDTVQ